MVKYTLDEGIAIAKSKHPDYEYIRESYSTIDRKININCPEHGMFRQRLYYSIIGCKCPECAIDCRTKKRSGNTDSFIQKAKEVHGDKYDYSKTEYINSSTNVIIICPIHGEFLQTPSSHISQKSGCPMCQRNHHINRDIFIERARKIHGDKYDYSKVVYKSNTKKVCIICPEHGEFWQTPKIHLRGFGCKKCSNNYLDKSLFIEKANKIHDNKYDYSNVEYLNNHTKVCIICPEHGEFWQKPNQHLSGQGCPLCKTSHLERNLELFLNKNNINHIYQYRNKSLFDKQNLDFYLPEINLAIECQGEQHIVANFFKSKGIEYAEKHLEYIKNLDKKKKKICNDNGIELIYYVDKKIQHYFKNYLGKVFYDKDELLEYINNKNFKV